MWLLARTDTQTKANANLPFICFDYPPGVVDLSDKGVVLLPECHFDSLLLPRVLLPHCLLPAHQDMLTNISLTTLLLLASMDNKQ